jgi:hypothetical protein
MRSQNLQGETEEIHENVSHPALGSKSRPPMCKIGVIIGQMGRSVVRPIEEPNAIQVKKKE